MTRLPVDEDARKRIRQDLDATLFVEAGAGSGKTRELVQRIVNLVISGIPLPRIAAITFTNAAAAELRDRVRAELAAASLVTATPEAADRIDAALASIDAASIQTLHSFAQGILGAFPVEAGLPPELTARDEVAASVAFDDRWQPFLEDLLHDGAGDPLVADALVRGFSLGLRESHLRRIAEAFHEEWDRVLRTDFDRPSLPEIDAAPFIAEIRAARSLAGECIIAPAEDKMVAHLEGLGQWLPQVEAAQDALERAENADERLAAECLLFTALPARKPGNPWRTGRKDNWRGQSLETVRRHLEEAERQRELLLDGSRSAAIAPILGAIQQFVRDYRDERVREGALEFQDMLFLARDLLRADTSVRTRVRDRFSAILVDEFQDTDPIQVEIAVLLATLDPAAGSKNWDEIPVIPGRLFFVGDPKQSIYRFRRADIDLYTDAQRHLGDMTGTTVNLEQNFRSVPGVIDWVNAIFSRLFCLDRGTSGQQVPFYRLEAHRESPGTPAVYLLGGPVTLSGENGTRNGEAQRMRVRESREIASFIASIAIPRSPLATSPGEPPRRFSDIAILLPTRTPLPTLETALAAAGIPARVESRSLIFETQEVRDLTAILSAIADPTDQVAVVAALRTPGFGCSDRDLALYHEADGHWDYRRDFPPDIDSAGPVVRALQDLRDLNAYQRANGAALVVERVIRECRLFQVAFAGRRPRESWQRYRFIQEQARAFDAATGRSLRQFLRYLQRQAEDRARVNESAMVEDDDDAVRIMTIHAAKGLEFPVVILAGLGTKPANIPDTILWEQDGAARVRVGSASGPRPTVFETAGYSGLKSREDTMERLEDDRLLYVAATRARDLLVVSTYHPAPRDNDPHDKRHASGQCVAAECLHALCSEVPDLWRPLPAIAYQQPFALDGAQPREDTAADRDAWLAEREALFAANARPSVLAATAIARHARDIAEKAEQLDEESPWKKGRAGTSLGRAVHAVLQTIDLATGAGVEDAARAQALAEGIPGREDEVASLAHAALASEAVRAAITSGRYWREVYVSAPVEGMVVEGFIDLLYEGPAGLVVVDYKTDRIAPERADSLLETYRLQGAAYALALEEKLRRPVAACRFVFVQPREERDIPNLPAAIADVRALLATLGQPSAETSVPVP